jgi:hypothetical protein
MPIIEWVRYFVHFSSVIGHKIRFYFQERELKKEYKKKKAEVLQRYKRLFYISET